MSSKQVAVVPTVEDVDSVLKGGGQPNEGATLSSLYVLKVALSVTIFCASVSVVPILNKELFTAAHGSPNAGKPFPFPVATAFLQLGLVSAVTTLASVAYHVLQGWCQRKEHSWIFGPHFKYKLRHVAPVGIVFGLKYGVTNQGLLMVHTGTHLLLQSTDLIWTVALARIYNKERLGLLERGAAVLATAGSLLVGMQAGQTLDCPLPALIVNCSTPLMLALCVSTLRSAAKELFNPDNILGGSVGLMEFTALKLGCSAIVAFGLSLLLEAGNGITNGDHDAWWIRLSEQSTWDIVMLLSGGLTILIFQVNISWLAGLTSATTVGMVGTFKVVPQYLMNATIDQHVDLGPLHLGGACFILIASTVYTYSMSLAHQLELTLHGFQWLPRAGQAIHSPRFESGLGRMREPLLPS